MCCPCASLSLGDGTWWPSLRGEGPLGLVVTLEGLYTPPWTLPRSLCRGGVCLSIMGTSSCMVRSGGRGVWDLDLSASSIIWPMSLVGLNALVLSTSSGGSSGTLALSSSSLFSHKSKAALAGAIQ